MGYYTARNFYEEPTIDGEGHVGYSSLVLTAPTAHLELLNYIYSAVVPLTRHVGIPNRDTHDGTSEEPDYTAMLRGIPSSRVST